jgi:hypothetical protein
MTKTRARRKEKDQWDALLDQIGFCGPTREEAPG